MLTYQAILELIEFNSQNNDQEGYNKAFEKLKDAYLKFEDNSEFFLCLINLGNLYLVARKIDKAELISNKLNALLEFGEIKFSKDQKNIKDIKDKEKAKKNVDEVKSMVYCMNAKICHFKRKSEEAYSLYSKSVNLNPKNLEAAYGLSQILLHMENSMEAQKFLETCRSTKDYNFEVEKSLAFIYARNKKKHEEAIEMYRNAIEHKKDNIDCYLELAQLLEFRAPEECLKLFEHALELIRQSAGKQQENSVYVVKHILPEVLNNYSVVKLRNNSLQGVDVLLYESLAIVKKRLEESHQASQKIENVDASAQVMIYYYIEISKHKI